jgi:hypothetical protein
MKLVPKLNSEGYFGIVDKGESGLCGIRSRLYTAVLAVGLGYSGPLSTYEYESEREAEEALREWDGSGDPPGNWKVHEGLGFKVVSD